MHIKICEVSPRDGLQNHRVDVSTPDKISMVGALSACGFYSIEATSFVSPKWVPKMADGGDVMQGITRHSDVAYIVLTPNVRGVENALPHKPDMMCIFPASSETMSEKNLNADKKTVFEKNAMVVKMAHDNNIKIKACLSCAGYCPYEGDVAAATIADDVLRLLDMGCEEIGLADTAGGITGDKSKAVLEAVLKHISPDIMSGHFHDTNGYALDNVDVYMDAGISLFDSAILGLGGCPFVENAKGNLDTRKLLTHLHSLGHTTDIDMDAFTTAEDIIRPMV